MLRDYQARIDGDCRLLNCLFGPFVNYDKENIALGQSFAIVANDEVNALLGTNRKPVCFQNLFDDFQRLGCIRLTPDHQFVCDEIGAIYERETGVAKFVDDRGNLAAFVRHEVAISSLHGHRQQQK